MRLRPSRRAALPAAMSPGLSPVTKLPADVLMYIFKLGADTWKYQDGKTAIADLERQDSNWKPHHLSPNTSFQEAVSQVCQQWRYVALDMALLWNSLNFIDSPATARTLAYISRSKNVPLDIFVTFCRTQHTPRGRALISYRKKNLQLIMTTLLPHVSRWRSFVCFSDEPRYTNNLVTKLSTANAAPQLEEFVLNTRDRFTPWMMRGRDDEPTAREAYARDNRCLFKGHMPKLNFLGISRAVFSWELSNLLHTKNLTFLQIQQTEDDRGCCMTSGQLLQVLQSSRRLQNLIIDNFQDLKHESWTNVTVSLPALTVLAVHSVDESDFRFLLKHLSLPRITNPYGLYRTTGQFVSCVLCNAKAAPVQTSWKVYKVVKKTRNSARRPA